MKSRLTTSDRNGQHLPEERDGSFVVKKLVALLSRSAPLVGWTALGALACNLVWLASKPAVFRATATLQIDRERQSGGILGDLALLGRPSQATSEIEVLRSRTIAERTIDSPGDRPGDGERDDLAQDAEAQVPRGALGRRHLGLTTLVDDAARCAFASSLWIGGADSAETGTASPTPKVFASIDADGEDAPEAVRVEFVGTGDAARVRLTPFLRWFPEGRAEELEYVPGKALAWNGLVLRLHPVGDVSGQTFVLRRFSRQEALDRLMEHTRVAETPRNSGVIVVSYDDTDPKRAAETANALCHNYLDLQVTRGERRASRTLEFIRAQLEEQTQALDSAELDVVRLQQQSPHTIDVGRTAEAIIKELSELEVERVKLSLSRAALDEALERLAAGETSALSRLSPDLADPISLAYIEQTAELTAESELQERSDTGAFKTLLQGHAERLREESEKLALRIEAQRAAIAEFEAGDADALSRTGDATGEGGADPLVSAYLAQLAELDGKLATLERLYTAEHPEVLQLVEGIGRLRSRVIELAKSRLAGLLGQQECQRALLEGYRARLEGVPSDERARIAVAQERILGHARVHLQSRLSGLISLETDLREQKERVESRLAALPESERTLAGPRRRLQAHAEVVKFLLARQQEAEIARASTIAGAEFIDPAVPPARRRGPSVPLHVLGGLLLGALGGVALAFVRQALDGTIVNSADLEESSGLPVFGTVPDFSHGRLRFVAAGERFLALRDDPSGPVAEAYRALRANMNFALGADPDLRTLALTSCSKGEGKSATNISLAVAFAMSGKRVLLVDADMREPVVHRYFGFAREPGLSEVLRGDGEWTKLVRDTPFEGLQVLTAGGRTDSPGDLLLGERARAFLDAVRTRYDIAVFDVPPALAVADTESFASRLDAMGLVCRSREMTRTVVARAVDRLRGSGAHLIGCVLNGYRPSSKESKYDYGYGYGYGRDQQGAEQRQHASSRDTLSVR